jgi:hypothetical protein
MNDDLFDDLKLIIACNQCGKEIQQQIAGYENERPFFCPNCGYRHTFSKETIEKAKKDLEEADNALKDLSRNFKFGS